MTATKVEPAPRTWRERRQVSAHRGRIMVAVLCFAGLLAALMQTIVIPLLARLPEILRTGHDSASWVITATLLTAAVVTPISGRLGDMYGKRRVLLACLLILTLGCAICALSHSLPSVLVGRVLQGTALSSVPLGMAILREELRPARVPTAIALISATLGAGASVALPASALVAQRFDWHLMFAAATAFGVLAAVLVWAFVPESTQRTPGRFDIVGALGLTTLLLCLLVPITKGAAWGWTSARVLVPLALVPVLAALWLRYETRVPNPVVDLSATLSRPVLLTNIASVLAGFAMFTQNILTPQILLADPATGYGTGSSMVVAGAVLAPAGFVMMLLSPTAGRLSVRFGARATLLTGLLVTGLAYVVALLVPFGPGALSIVSAINGAGIGLAYGAMPALIMQWVPAGETAAATGLNTLMRTVGTSAASAVAAMLLAVLVTADHPPVPTEDAFRLGFALAAGAAALAALVVCFVYPLGARRAPDTVRAMSGPRA
ncbi:MFS transporter [Nocardia thailandica]